MAAQNTMEKSAQTGGLTAFRRKGPRLGAADSQKETAQYITDMVLELRNLARSAELKTLAGLLEIAFYEAFSLANKVEIPPAEIERLKALEAAAKDVA
jgi:hypothetical protein